MRLSCSSADAERISDSTPSMYCMSEEEGEASKYDCLMFVDFPATTLEILLFIRKSIQAQDRMISKDSAWSQTIFRVPYFRKLLSGSCRDQATTMQIPTFHIETIVT